MTNLNGTAHAHGAKLVLSFITLRKYQDQSDPLRSLITSRDPPPKSYTYNLHLLQKVIHW